MGEIEITIIDNAPPSKFGLPKSGERKPPLEASIVPVTKENLLMYQDQIGLPNNDRKEQTVKSIVEGNLHYFIAVDPESGNVAGYTNVGSGDENLLYVEVKPEYQGRKVGPQLIRTLQENFPHLSLTNMNGPEGEDFYANLGFVREGFPGHMVWNKPESIE